jgi:uncharacterized protein (TIGR02996 family)
VPDLDSLLDAVVAAPDDAPGPLLAYADWLAAHGEPERAEFIRLQASPAADGSSLPRVTELYAAHGKRWFAAVYDLIQTGVIRNTAGGLMATLGEVSAKALMAVSGVPARPPETPTPDPSPGGVLPVRVQEMIHPSGVTLTPDVAEKFRLTGGDVRLEDIGRAFGMAIVHRGVVTHVSLGAAGLLRREAVADVLTREPVTGLDLELPPAAELWRRFDGPHLRRVRRLKLQFHPEADAHDFGPPAEAVFTSPHLTGVTDLTLEAGAVPMPPAGAAFRPDWRHAATTGVVERLVASPLLPRLKSLALISGGGAGWLGGVAALADTPADGPLESLSVVSWEIQGTRPGPVPDVVAALARLPVRPRLKFLNLSGVPLGPDGVRRLLVDAPWERLESLSLGDVGAGDAGAGVVADTTALPALRHLHLPQNGIGDAGAVALAASPLAARLRTLDLSNNPFGDAGAEALAALLDDPALTMLNLYGATFAAGVRPPPALGWADRVTMWAVLPFRALIWVALKLGAAGRKMPTSQVSTRVRQRLKEKYGQRIYFGA